MDRKEPEYVDVEQRFPKKEFKELIDAVYFNNDDTEILRFAIYRPRGKSREYYLLIHRYKNWLYNTNGFIPETLFYREEIITGKIGNAVQALRQAIQEYSTDDMTIEYLYIDDNLASKANITWEERLSERLEKLYQAFQAQKERTRKRFPSP